MNPNTPLQPNDHEVRTFRVGPMSETEFALLPERFRHDVHRVHAGELHENDDDVNVVAPQVYTALRHVQAEISAHAQLFLLNAGVHNTQVAASLGRLQTAEQLPPELGAITKENIEAILQETVRQIIFGIDLALEEVLMNHAKHGNRDPRRKIGGRYWIDDSGALQVVSWDSGNGFIPEDVPDPTRPDLLPRPNGRGRMLAKCFTSKFADGAEGPTGELGTSVHMQVQLAKLDEFPQEDMPALTALDKHVRTAVGEVLRKERQKKEQTAEQQMERERDARLRTAWFGLRGRLAKWLRNA